MPWDVKLNTLAPEPSGPLEIMEPVKNDTVLMAIGGLDFVTAPPWIRNWTKLRRKKN